MTHGAICGHCMVGMIPQRVFDKTSPYRQAIVPERAVLMRWTCPACGREFATVDVDGASPQPVIVRHIGYPRRGGRVMPRHDSDDD